jgi:hypothetical protein
MHNETNHNHEDGSSGDGDGSHQNATLSTIELGGDVNVVFFPQRRGRGPGHRCVRLGHRRQQLRDR